MHFKRVVCGLFCIAGILISPLYSQSPIEDFMRSTGKIYVVVAVLAVIFLLIIGYLIFLDRKIRRLEKQLPNDKHD
jgi:CcmD family protein